MLFCARATLIQGTTFIFFLQYVPGGTFIPGAKFIPESRVAEPFKIRSFVETSIKKFMDKNTPVAEFSYQTFS